MAKDPFPRVRLLSSLLLVTLFLPAASKAQYHPLDLPADSPAWWTLSDSVQPEDLRASHSSPEANLERYWLDVAEGLAEPLPGEQESALRFHLNTQRNPELFPFWYAFDIFASVRMERESRQSAAAMLSKFGMSTPGIETTLDEAADHSVRLASASANLRSKQVEFVKMYRLAQQSLKAGAGSAAALEKAQKNLDTEFFARLSGYATDRVDELLAAANASPILTTSMRTLPLLRQQLSAEDWLALQSFLREEIVPRVSARTDLEEK